MKRQIKRLQKPRNGIQYIIDHQTRTELSPFVFFDAGKMTRKDEGLFIGKHPHSGIGIITYFEGGNLKHDDSTKNGNIIPDGGAQWIRAGKGIWHEEHYVKKEDVQSVNWALSIHQLWLQLPPELEEAEGAYQNIYPDQLPIVNNVKIISGTYKGHTSPLKTPYNLTYIDVHLKADEAFTFSTPEGQTTGFIYPREGSIRLYESPLPLGHISILESNEGILEIKASAESKFVLLTSVPQNFPIISQRGSIHTNSEALQRSMERINDLKL